MTFFNFFSILNLIILVKQKQYIFLPLSRIFYEINEWGAYNYVKRMKNHYSYYHNVYFSHPNNIQDEWGDQILKFESTDANKLSERKMA